MAPKSCMCYSDTCCLQPAQGWALGFLAKYQETSCLCGEHSCVDPSEEMKASDGVDGNMVPSSGSSENKNHEILCSQDWH